MLHLSDIEKAAAVVRPVIHHTPVMTCHTIEERLADGVALRLKAENFQRTGAFKIRGAYYRLSQLTDAEKRCGVAAVSAGNHAQGVALAAQLLGVQATIFMPETASIAKIKATEGYGAEVVLAGKNFDESAIACHRYVAENDAVYISPYDDDGVIAGQGTLGLELLDDLPNVETVMVPIGGGGLFAGVALAIKESRPNVRIIGVQAEGADTAARSFHAGHLLPREEPVSTICDGIAVKSPAARTFDYIRKYADDVVTVSDFAVAEAMLLLAERAKLVVEPSGAAGLAALLAGKADARGETAVILCGGNIDALRLADIAQREMLRADRYLHLFTACDDRPGSLARLLEIVAVERGNVITVSHNRLSPHISLGKTRIELLIEVRDRAHRERILTALRGDGYPVETLL
ncbi:threonine ammonia-lyase [Capsulimonas corticalis]|uniref:L-threonine dehydratase catabolic TdcB n=1 Tax=Capsulimonas corticalis TaxID=2219043 RepID=A0A402CW56_9BACT|nr:threonine ammonia-lyase [Capsulimonas corticalis]BDI34021.1 threonine ammonia-lyase [Capsulimonas corticalis]